MKSDNTVVQVTSHNAQKNTFTILTLVFFFLTICCVFLANVIPIYIAAALSAIFLIITFICAFKIKTSSQDGDLRVVKNPKPVDVEAIERYLADDEKVYTVDNNNASEIPEVYVYSFAASKEFVMNPFEAVADTKLYEFPEEILDYTMFLKDSRDKELSKFAALRPDKSVMGLRSDLDLETLRTKAPFVLSSIYRSSTQLTDDSFNKVIYNRDKINKKVVFNGRSLCLDSNGALKKISETKTANEIDIHTIIISSDGYIMFRKGTKLHPLFADQVVTSASCSLIPSGIDYSLPIQDSMISVLHQKISQIYNLSLNDVEISSSFCGFARIVTRCGAPEFYAITRIDLTKDEIMAKHNDETACFIEDWHTTSLVSELSDSIDAPDYISRAMKTIMETMSTRMSVSSAALFNSVYEAMSDDETSTKILQRIGIIPREEGYNRHSIGTFGNAPSIEFDEETTTDGANEAEDTAEENTGD